MRQPISYMNPWLSFHKQKGLVLNVVRMEHKNEENAWDEYVQGHPSATFFHQTGWKRVVERTFKHESIYLFAEEKGQVKGILPLFLIKSLYFGKFAVSIPYAIYGGICADNSDVERLLLQRADEIARERKIRYIEFRNRGEELASLPTNDLYVYFPVKLPSNPEDVLKILSSDTRRCIRKAKKQGLHVFRERGELKVFYHLYQLNMRKQGAPVLPYCFLKNIVEEFDGKVSLAYVKLKDRIITAAIDFIFRNTLLGYYLGSDPDFRKLHPNHLIYAGALEWAVRHGMEGLDFARSRKGSGSYFFKKNLGLTPKPLFYQYDLVRAKRIPQVNPSNPKFDLARKVWSVLPLPVTRWVGPHIIKSIP